MNAKSELKNAIQASEATVWLDLKTLKKKVPFLEKEKTEVRKKFEILDGKLARFQIKESYRDNSWNDLQRKQKSTQYWFNWSRDK